MGIGGDQIPQASGDTETLRQLLDPLCSQRSGNPVYVPDKVQILDARQIFIQIRVIRQISHPLLAPQRLLPNGTAVNEDLSFFKLQDSGNRLQSGGLPRSVAADEAVNIPRTDLQIQAGNRPLPAPVGLGKTADGEYGSGILPPLRTGILSFLFPLSGVLSVSQPE